MLDNNLLYKLQSGFLPNNWKIKRDLPLGELKFDWNSIET